MDNYFKKTSMIQGLYLVPATFTLSDNLEDLQKKRDELCEKINIDKPDPFLFLEFQAVVRRHAQLFLEKNKTQRSATAEELQEEKDEEEKWLREEDEVWLRQECIKGEEWH